MQHVIDTQKALRMQVRMRDTQILHQGFMRVVTVDVYEAQRCATGQGGKFLSVQLAGIDRAWREAVTRQAMRVGIGK